MGHTLLAIRQPPQEQPIHARDARITLVYNGELYDTAGSGAHDTAALLARIVPVLRAADPLAERPGLNGDAPVFFSGGVDSALLARLLDRAGAQVTLRTLSITDSVLDQGTQAGKAARCLGLPLETVELDPAGVAGDTDRCLATMDQPTVDAINAALVFARGSQPDGRVVFTGTGLDELYNGYVWNNDCLRHFAGKTPAAARCGA